MSDEQRMRRVRELLEEDLLQQASAALVSDPPSEVTPAVVAEMRQKHPAEREGEQDRLHQLPRVAPAAALRATPEQVADAIKSFNRGSGAGPSGLRPQHLKDALVAGWRDELLRQATLLVNLLLSGEASPDVQPWLCGAALTALPKPSGDLRPVAVGETWRRLASKVGAKVATAELRPCLEPLQLGVGSKGGCEAVVHVARQWLQRHCADPSRVLATMDLSNAFNSVDRSAFLSEARRHCHELVPWLDYCYKNRSNLRLGTEQLASTRGIQQGDPLGPLLFSLAIQEDIAQAKAEAEVLFPGELDWVAFFLDDGTVAGTARAVKHFADRLLSSLASRGLSANVAKCEAVSAAGAAGADSLQLFPGWQHVQNGCFKLLGAPLGTTEFCTRAVLSRVGKARALLTQVAKYEDPQGGLHLLRYCASWSKVQYACRTVPPALITAALSDFDAATRETASVLASGQLPDYSWSLAQLPVSKGGLGLRASSLHSAAAFLGSFRATFELCQLVDPGFDPGDTDAGLGLQDALARLKDACLPQAPIRGVDLSDPVLLGSQKRLSAQVDACVFEKLAQDHGSLASVPEHLALSAVPGAAAWLTAPPTQDDRRIDGPLMRVCIQRRLRMPIFSGDDVCPLCGAPMDRFGDHAMVCPCGGDRVVRHNSVRDQLFSEMRDGDVPADREKAGLLPGRPSEDGLPVRAQARRPADIWVPATGARPPLAVDFAVTSGLRRLAPGPQADLVTPVFEDYENHKRSFQDTDAQCRHQGLTFIPFIIEAHAGGLSPLARRTLDAFSSEIATRSHEAPAAVALRVAQRMSCSLQRESARAVLRRQPVGAGSAAVASGWDAVPPNLHCWQ